MTISAIAAGTAAATSPTRGARQACGDEGPNWGCGAVLLYAMGNMSSGMIARLFGVSEVADFKWIRKEAAALPEPVTPADVEIVQLDEMWHFVDGKKTNAGSGRLSIRSTGEPQIRQGGLGFG